MNLYDLVARNDRMLLAQPGAVGALNLKLPGGTQRAIRLEADGDGINLQRADEATALRSFPSAPGWTAYPAPGAKLEVWLETTGSKMLLATASIAGEQICLSWPVPSPAKFDLRLIAKGGPVDVAVGPLFNPRARLLPVLRGKGVEVGPGANPALAPSVDCDVSYLEKMSAEEWDSTYAKRKLGGASTHWERYILGEAHEMAGFKDGTLDFIFSSHVVEHLVNPLGVLRNWWRKLAPGGIVAGVIPDARYTFDYRQPCSRKSDFLDQFKSGSFDPTDEMYERWCRYTAPYNSPESLKARGYSIHVNFYTVDAMCDLLDLFAELEDIRGRFIESVANGKDFAFLVQKQ